MTATAKPRLLIFSYSPIAEDGRVMRQVNEFVQHYDVVTCGGGPKPHPDVEHVRVEYHIPRFWARLIAVCLHSRWFWAAYWLLPVYRQTRQRLRRYSFDVVLANDLTAAGVARAVAPAHRVHFDLHEYWPGVMDDNDSWVKLRIPFYNYLLRRYVAGAGSVTAVSDVIAERYQREFGFACGVVTNASTYRRLPVREVNEPIRFVHSGVAKSARKIEVMMKAVAASGRHTTLDLYLTGKGTKYYAYLERLAHDLGDRIRLNDAVPHAQLVETLNSYDVGLTILPPTTTNIELCLPNKFFDFIQARLMIMTGPTRAMQQLTEQYDLGVVTDDFTVERITAAINALTVEQIFACKLSADRHAQELSSAAQTAKWQDAIDTILQSEQPRQKTRVR